jgi:hypothetical protein
MYLGHERTPLTLHRLSEANIESILGDIEALYRDHSRHGAVTFARLICRH